MTTMRGLWILPAVLIAAFAGAQGAAAEDLTFRVKSMAEKNVQIRFFSQDRRVTWRAHDLDDYNEHNIELSCIRDERICYGAWIKNRPNEYWGAGADGRAACTDCCYKCTGGQTRRIVLRETVRR